MTLAKEMKSSATKLPPWWVRFPSYFFVLFLCAPIFVIVNIAGLGNVEFLGMSFTREDGDPLGWMLLLDTLFFAAGITALGILQRRPWAYDFGLGYVIAAMLVGGAGMLVDAGGARSEWQAGVLQIGLLFFFGIHLLRHRSTWRNEVANKSR